MAERPGPGLPVEHCQSCSGAVVWAKTERGRWMPVDAEPSSRGTVRLEAGTGRPERRPGPGDRPAVVPPRARVLSAKLAFGVRGLREPHWSTCPYADSHRRGTAGARRR